jgi:hypothetical protein
VPASSSALEDTLKTFIELNGLMMQELKNSMMINSQAIQEVKSATMVNTQAIAKMESQIGQIANHLGERENGEFPSQPVPNPEAVTVGNSSSLVHGQEHVHVIITLRSGRQVDNQVVEPKADSTKQEGQKGEESGNKEERDAETSTATPS